MTSPPASDALDDFADLLSDEQELAGPTPEQRQKRRRRGWTVAGIVAGMLAVAIAVPTGYVNWAIGAELPDPVGSVRMPAVPTPEAIPVAMATDGASAIAITGAEEYLGADGLQAASGGDDARSIASITKLVTALVIIDAHPLADGEAGPTLTFDRSHFRIYDKYYVLGASIARSPIGSSMSLRDALATMLIPSASNYAEVLATWAFGSNDGFTHAARSWLDANGLPNTTIVEPTGIDPRNVSTPSELLALGRIAAAHPVVAPITAMQTLTLDGPGTMWNTNELLAGGEVTGLKTGTLDGVGSNLLYTATVDVGASTPLSVVGVLLGGSTDYAVNAAVQGTLDSVRAGFRSVDLAEAGDVVGRYEAAWGADVPVVIAQDASIASWSDLPITATMEASEPKAWRDGVEVGEITWQAGPNTVSVAIEIDGDLEPPSDQWRLTHPDQLG